MLCVCKYLTHCYVKSVAVWYLVVDDSLDIDRLQLELYGNVDQPVGEKKEKNAKQIKHKSNTF